MSRPAAERLAGLRRSLAAIEAETGFSDRAAPLAFGVPDLDRALGGGLPYAALHEVFPAAAADAPAAAGFVLALMLRGLEPGRKIVWVRQDMAVRESGELYASGLVELGADPSAVIQVRVRDALSALRAAEEALRCAALGAVAIETWGAPKALDLTATRRLARAAEASGTASFLIRTGGEPAPSAAASRWRVRAAPSRALAMGAPGAAMFEAELLRHRAGISPRCLCMEWDRDQRIFRTPLSGAVAAPAARRPAASFAAPLRRAG